jgi:hypothetical protein
MNCIKKFYNGSITIIIRNLIELSIIKNFHINYILKVIENK